MTANELYEALRDERAYTASEVKQYMAKLDKDTLPRVKKRGSKKSKSQTSGKEYYNIACSFDIETTSFDDKYGDKVATMYIWMFNINGIIIYGRTWEEWLYVYENIVEHLDTANVILPVYIRNFQFEFQFIHKWHHWVEIFALDKREPIKGLTAEGFEFRCSYKLSGLSLAETGKNLIKYPVKKMVGDLDYTLIRHSKTTLTDAEMGYCLNDVRVDVAYILEEIEENNNNVTLIPMTKTGYVRRYVRDYCNGAGIKDKRERNKQYNRYRALMKSLTMSVDEYQMLLRAFQGGFTHASNWTVTQVQENVVSFDEASAYPAQMLSRQFPMSPAQVIDNILPADFEHSIKYYCCVFDIKFEGLKARRGCEHIISGSKCHFPKKCANGKTNVYLLDNGKVMKADELYTTITEVDYKLIKKLYSWKNAKVGRMYRYIRGYLPKPFVEAVLKLYYDKCVLKGVEGKERLLAVVKGMLNSTYGMSVTRIARDVVSYDYSLGYWNQNNKPDLEAVIDEYNKSPSRFLAFQWGIYITAYAREAIIETLSAMGDDYCYTDTDSIKFKNPEKHMDIIEAYNDKVVQRLQKAMDYNGLDWHLTCYKGKQLGVFELDGKYKKFKSNGAKRYLVQYEDDEVALTVSGLLKAHALVYMLDCAKVPYHVVTENKETIYSTDHESVMKARPLIKHIYADGDTKALFDFFSTDMEIPADFTGKNIHTYFDHEISGTITDYLGNKAEYHELSGINLSPTSYSAREDVIWLKYIFGKAGIVNEK